MPVISVIVPAFNEISKVKDFIAAIENQTYDREKIDLIVVDNGSTDGTVDYLESSNLKLIKASEKKSPYYARNIGFRSAEGDIIALLDMNKIPAKDWLQVGIEYLTQTDADMITGKVEFQYSSDATVYELMDSIMYLDNKHLVKSSGACAAGNLMFKKKVLESVGGFSEQRSGMDMVWTRKATKSGYHLVYVEGLKVTTSAKKKGELIKKSIRVGTGHPYMWKKDNISLLKILLIIGKNFVPPLPSSLKEVMKRREIKAPNTNFRKLYFIYYFNQILVGVGRIIGLRKIANL